MLRRLRVYNNFISSTYAVIGWNDFFDYVGYAGGAWSPSYFRFFPQRDAPPSAPTITNYTAPNGMVNTPYGAGGEGFQFTATANPTWTHTGGTLPQGLTLNAEGLLFGTPTQSGSFTFTVRAANEHGNTERQITVQIAPQENHPTPSEAVISIGTAFADPGDTNVPVGVRIFGNPGFTEMMMRIEFPTELELVGYTLAADIANANFVINQMPQFGGNDDKTTVYMGWYAADEITQNGILVTLHFNVCDEIATQQVLPISATFNNAEGEEVLRNANREPLNIHIADENGGVRIQSAMIGDIGGSGRITSESAALFAKYLVGHYVIADTRAMDVTGNGNMGSARVADLVRLSRILVGIYPMP
jgi:hypothetical protein